MSKRGISEKVKQFIFDRIDSVEQLDILLFIRAHKDKEWNCEQLAHELRSSENSVSTRIESLKIMQIIEELPHDKTLCRYKKGSQEIEETLDELNEIYKLKKQKIFELIFSPLKKGRSFANAFVVKSSKDNGEDEDA